LPVIPRVQEAIPGGKRTAWTHLHNGDPLTARTGRCRRDGSPVLVSKQCGAAVLIRRLAEKGVIHFDDDNHPASVETIDELDDAVRYDPVNETAAAAQLQAALNHLPGISLAVDGIAGKRTSDAVRRITGHYLAGDPRA
jgi:hypothetical protein